MRAKYKFTGSKEDYYTALRQFELDELLIRINRESIAILYNSNHNAVEFFSIPLRSIDNKQTTRQEIIVSAWQLNDLAYHAINASNDYRGIIPSEKDIHLLCLETNSYMNEKEKVNLADIGSTPKLLFYVCGFMGEQLKMQTVSEVFDNAARELYILFGLEHKNLSVDIPNIVLQETGVRWEVLISSLLFIWTLFLHNDDLENAMTHIQWNNNFKKDDFQKVIDRYTTDYSKIRQSGLGRQIFYTHPFVKTQRGKVISINTYLNLYLYEHSVLWALRDHYKKENSGLFLNLFGKFFEDYFQELLETYVEKEKYEKIENIKGEHADWKLELSGYSMLIEQKSSVLGLSAKQQESSYSEVEKFTINTLKKALHQLKSTEKYYGKRFIKIILLYEDYLAPEILDFFFNMPECDVENDHYYWIVTIDEMEKLLYIYKNENEIFMSIIEDKIQRENQYPKNGKRFRILLDNYKVERKNSYIEEKMQRFRDLPFIFLKKNMSNKISTSNNRMEVK